MIIRNVDPERDQSQIYQLYKSVSVHNPGSINQETQEITTTYIKQCIRNGIQRGIVLVAQINNQIVAYLKGFTSPFLSVAHVLGDVTIMVHPQFQNKKIGREIILELHRRLQSSMKHIYKVELLPHDTNIRSIELYKKLGYKIMYSSFNKILNPDRTYGDQVLMEIINPMFDKNQLNTYHKYLLQLGADITPQKKIYSYCEFVKSSVPAAKL